MGGGECTEILVGTEVSCDVDEAIFVAVGKNVEESKSILSWSLQKFPGKSICLLHVHQPPALVSMVNERFSASKVKHQVVKAYPDLERHKMHKLLNQLLLNLAQVEAGKVWVEMDDIQRGIVHIIEQLGIRWLVMGAASEKHFFMEMSQLKSSKAIFVSQQAPPSCNIWFVCRGHIIYIRERSFSVNSHEKSFTKLSTSEVAGEEKIHHDLATEDMDMDSNKIKVLEHLSLSEDQAVDSQKVDHSLIGEAGGIISSLSSQHKSQENHACSVSIMSLQEKYQLIATREEYDKLEHAFPDAERSKQKVFEESVERWKAEDVLNTVDKLEKLCLNETWQQNKMEEMLAVQKKELETLKHQHNHLREKLQIVQEQTLTLEGQIMESHGKKKELEDKIVQAGHLLVSFKKRRDELQKEHQSALEEMNRLQKLVKDDAVGPHNIMFFSCSFSDIIEITKNFDPSAKISEGRHGSTYKGLLRHMKVAIKMLPSGGSLSDIEFEREVASLSKVRHPNILTLIGTCPETRALIYEYLENGSLEDRLACKRNSPPLSWQTRLRICSEICSALIFLHTNQPPIIHGNLTPTKILLDVNFVCKLIDLGRHQVLPRDESLLRTISCNKNVMELSAYIAPECLDGEEVTAESDVYSFGIILLQLLTGRPAVEIVKDVKCALESGNLDAVLDISAGDWPLEQAKQIAHLGLRCCEKQRLDRLNTLSEILDVIEPMRDLCMSSSVNPKAHRKVPSHFVCPIYQEIMKDPYIAADGFTYDCDAISGWLNGDHRTSPMTNLKLENCDLLPNYALYYAIQEWHHQL